MLPEGFLVRPLRDADSIAALTELLHRSYAPLAARGMRFLATHQPEETTRLRCTKGECLVVEHGGRVVATLIWYRSRDRERPALYERPDVAVFGQFCVAQEFQGRGIGRALVAEAERRAAAAGFTVLACDTASPATDLIAMYERWGFRRVDRIRWSEVNYESVVLAKEISAAPHGAPDSARAGV